jgi:adenylate cyclase
MSGDAPNSGGGSPPIGRQVTVQAAKASPHVFVSYASQDGAVANSIVESLEQHGLRCWLAPRDVKPGALYADAIVGAINEAKALVLVLSGSAITSSHVSREVERAASKRKPMIAFRIDAAPLSRALEYFLGESQWIDVRGLGMSAALAKLAEAVGQGWGQTVAADPVGSTKPLERTGVRVKLIAGVAVVISVGVAVALGVRFWSQSHKAPQSAAAVAITDKSVAVLPFVDMSEKKDQEYFSDGLSEELIDMLTKVPELKVPARTSSFYFKGKQATIADIAKALGVTHVLEGSVRKSGNTLRITVQLIRVDTGYHVWSETYDRKLDDIFQIQDEIAKSVVNGLKVSVLGGTIPRTRPTANHDAYILYLQAKEMHYRGTADTSRKSIEYLQKALELDPDFSQGWLTLASFLAADYNLFNPVPHDETREPIYSALDHARKLEPSLVPIHVVMGRVLYEVDWRWQAADVEMKEAIALEPGNAEAHRLAAYLATTLGRFDEAVEQAEKAIELDPLQPWNYIARGYAAYRSGRLEQAEANYRTALGLAPGSGKFHCLLGTVLIARGQRESALAEMEKEPAPRFHQVGMALALEMLGQRNDSDKELRVAEQKLGDEMGYWIAIVYAARRDPDRAFAWLDRAFHAYGDGMTWIKGDPLLGSLVGDPRYKALLQKMNLPE